LNGGLEPQRLPLVSVIMPNYNKGKYVRDAIESVLSQTYENFELIIVDDGSADESLDIIDEYARKDSRIVYTRQDHRGIGTAHNTGIALAKGDFIARQDSDDVSAREKLSKQVALLNGAPPSVCYTDGWKLDAFGTPTGEIYNRDQVRLPKSGYEGDVFRQLLRNGEFVLHATIMMHRECLKLEKFETRYPAATDWDLSVRLARRFPFRYIPEPLYGYREHANNTWEPANMVRNLRGQAAMQRNWLKTFNLEPSDRKFVTRHIIRTEYSTNNYAGLIETGLGNPMAFRVLLRETVDELRHHRNWLQLRATLRVDQLERAWLWRNIKARFMFAVMWPVVGRGAIADLTTFEWRAYSQNGEDGILRAMFLKLGTTSKFCVELGVGDGTECNTRYLTERLGWNALLVDMDRRAPASVKKEFVTPDNVNLIFQKCGVPEEFDLLSIDLDYNTYWVWRAIEGYRPRVVVIEYNALIPPNQRKVVKNDPSAVWDGKDDYFGASLAAIDNLGRQKGYTLVACDSMGVNAFLVRNDLAGRNFRVGNVEELYRPLKNVHFRPSSREWANPTGEAPS
jgi:glycosyltransferase involved in cell wall biosynthesis